MQLVIFATLFFFQVTDDSSTAAALPRPVTSSPPPMTSLEAESDVMAEEGGEGQSMKKQKLEQELEDKDREIERLKMQLIKQADYDKLKREVQ